MSAPEAYGVAAAARAYGLPENQIRAAINTGRLKAKRVGRLLLIKAADLREWFDALEDARP